MRSLAGNKFWIVKHEMQVIDKSLTEDINLTFFFLSSSSYLHIY